MVRRALSLIGCALCLVTGASARAAIVASDAHGFEIRHSVDVGSDPAAAFAAFARVGQWWSGVHSYSGDPANMVLTLTPGGCFCEKLPAGGGVEHMRVAMVTPGKRVVLSGALGPLLFEAVAGVMDVSFTPSGQGTRIAIGYRASGFARGGADKIAPAVDIVIGEQVARLGRFADGARL